MLSLKKRASFSVTSVKQAFFSVWNRIFVLWMIFLISGLGFSKIEKVYLKFWLPFNLFAVLEKLWLSYQYDLQFRTEQTQGCFLSRTSKDDNRSKWVTWLALRHQQLSAVISESWWGLKAGKKPVETPDP